MADRGAAYPYGAMNFIPAFVIHFRIANIRTRWRCNFSQDGGRTDFLKTSATHFLMTTYQMKLLSARSISLDSTFKEWVNP
jgi:hypothetical protein